MLLFVVSHVKNMRQGILRSLAAFLLFAGTFLTGRNATAEDIKGKIKFKEKEYNYKINYKDRFYDIQPELSKEERVSCLESILTNELIKESKEIRDKLRKEKAKFIWNSPNKIFFRSEDLDTKVLPYNKQWLGFPNIKEKAWVEDGILYMSVGAAEKNVTLHYPPISKDRKHVVLFIPYDGVTGEKTEISKRPVDRFFRTEQNKKGEWVLKEEKFPADVYVWSYIGEELSEIALKKAAISLVAPGEEGIDVLSGITDYSVKKLIEFFKPEIDEPELENWRRLSWRIPGNYLVSGGSPLNENTRIFEYHILGMPKYAALAIHAEVKRLSGKSEMKPEDKGTALPQGKASTEIPGSAARFYNFTKFCLLEPTNETITGQLVCIAEEQGKNLESLLWGLDRTKEENIEKRKVEIYKDIRTAIAKTGAARKFLQKWKGEDLERLFGDKDFKRTPIYKQFQDELKEAEKVMPLELESFLWNHEMTKEDVLSYIGDREKEYYSNIMIAIEEINNERIKEGIIACRNPSGENEIYVATKKSSERPYMLSRHIFQAEAIKGFLVHDLNSDNKKDILITYPKEDNFFVNLLNLKEGGEAIYENEIYHREDAMLGLEKILDKQISRENYSKINWLIKERDYKELERFLRGLTYRENRINAEIAIVGIDSAISMYKYDVGKFPESLKELIGNVRRDSKWKGPYIRESEIKDVFGNSDYYYEVNGNKVIIGSVGLNGKRDLIWDGIKIIKRGDDIIDSNAENAPKSFEEQF